MINKVGKYLFYGIQESIDAFFAKAQSEGFIEFINPDGVRSKELPKHISETITAINLLKKLPKSDEYCGDVVSPNEVVEEVLTLRKTLETLDEEYRLVHLEIAKIQPFGDFSLDDIRELEEMTGRRMHFYTAKHEANRPEDFPQDLILITTDHDLDYFISFSEQKIDHHGLNEVHILQSLSRLKQNLESITANRKHARKKLKSFAVYLGYLRKSLIDELNLFHLHRAKGEVTERLDSILFSIEAWVPKKHLNRLNEMIEGMGIEYEEIAIEEGDSVPTSMDNTGVAAIGEDLVHIYDTPSINDADPSRWVFWSFAVFFAVIIADAGYGFIYLLLGLFLKWRVKKPSMMVKNLINLVLTLATCCIIWGVLISSYFGLNFSPTSTPMEFSLIGFLVEKKAEYHLAHLDGTYREWLKLIPKLEGVTNPAEFVKEGFIIKEGKREYLVLKSFSDSILLEISLIIGMFHVSLGLLRNLRKHWAGIGWVVAIFGGYLYCPKVLDATTIANFIGIVTPPYSYELGMQMLGVGVGGAIILSFIQNRLGGLGEIVKSIELFADVLSYLRLYALGLAAVILAETFNSMGEMLGFAIGFLVIIVGHCTNMVLGIMGGVIHGLRLNFLEWYHHCFEGGGRLFAPLRKINYD
ncbi:MAG: V-type ATP synthase subunit I [Simkaniaceae bacterium]|nr:V-type ATP synthase subunit I [Simkaniaceae bacterium]